MKGLEALRELRVDEGSVPRCVWIVDGPDERSEYWESLPNYSDKQIHAVLEVEEDDLPESLDLRTLVGLTVHIGGERGFSRLRRLHQAAIEAQARIVVTSLISGRNIELITHGI